MDMALQNELEAFKRLVGRDFTDWLDPSVWMRSGIWQLARRPSGVIVAYDDASFFAWNRAIAGPHAPTERWACLPVDVVEATAGGIAVAFPIGEERIGNALTYEDLKLLAVGGWRRSIHNELQIKIRYDRRWKQERLEERRLQDLRREEAAARTLGIGVKVSLVTAPMQQGVIVAVRDSDADGQFRGVMWQVAFESGEFWHSTDELNLQGS